jgi:hypothetical protein
MRGALAEGHMDSKQVIGNVSFVDIGIGIGVHIENGSIARAVTGFVSSAAIVILAIGVFATAGARHAQSHGHGPSGEPSAQQGHGRQLALSNVLLSVAAVIRNIAAPSLLTHDFAPAPSFPLRPKAPLLPLLLLLLLRLLL